MPPSITLAIGYPKELIRAGLRAMLQSTNIKIVAEACNAKATDAAVAKHRPALLLMDATIPGTREPLTFAGRLVTLHPGTKVVLLAPTDDPILMARAKVRRVMNFLDESVTKRELVAALQQAAAGRPASATSLFGRVAAAMDNPRLTVTAKAGLTLREARTLAHVAHGLSDAEIALSLGITLYAAKQHVKAVLRKLPAVDRIRAAVWALRRGLA